MDNRFDGRRGGGHTSAATGHPLPPLRTIALPPLRTIALPPLRTIAPKQPWQAGLTHRYRGPVTVYAVALLSIHDRARYDRYVAAFMPVLRKYGGRLLAADDRPEVAEGQWSGNRVVILQFPDRDAFTSWSASPEYREIAKDRLAAAGTDVLLVRGLP